MSNVSPTATRYSSPETHREVDLEGIAALLEDEYARAILRHTNEEPLSARDLMDRCNVSKATVYRRINRLRDHGLIETRQQHDPNGHHHETYTATFEAMTVEFVDGSFEVSLDRVRDSDEDAPSVDAVGDLRG